MGKFPHLQNANGWPGLDHVDPFGLEVEFNPYVWEPDVTIHLVQTRLDAGYRNVVDWKSKEERDAWYDARSDKAFVLDSEFHVLPGQEVKLPVPFSVLNEYNQLYIDFPAPPVQYGGTGTYRYYYFISDVEYRSPSTTACIITVDEWTTHALELDMPYIRLERGHAPLAAVTVDDYLSNPMDNAELLAVRDDSYGDIERLQHESIALIDDPDVWAVLALSSSIWEDPNAIGTDQWHTPYSHRLMTQGAPSIQTVAVSPSDLPTLLENIEEIAPQMISTIQACYVIAKKWVNLGYDREAYGVQVHEIGATQRLQQLVQLDKSMFNFPERYREIAKLYTSPYSCLELVDQSGASQHIRIEDTTGRLQISVAAALTWPALGLDVFVTGIGSSGTGTLSWSTFDRHVTQYGGMWTQTLRHFSIPCFMITANPQRQYALHQYYAVAQAEEQNQAAADMAYRTNQASYDMQIAGLDRQAARLIQQQANDTAQKTISQNADNQNISAQQTKMDNDQTADAAFSQAALDTSLNMISLAQGQAVASNAQAIESAVVAQGVALANEKDVQAQVALARQQADAQYGTSIYSIQPAEVLGTIGSAAIGAPGAGGTLGNLLSGVLPEWDGAGQATAQAIVDKVGGALNSVTGGLSSGLVGLAGGMTSAEYEAMIAHQTAQLASAHGSVQQAQLNLNGACMTAAQMNASYSMSAGSSAATVAQSIALALSKIANAKALANTQNSIVHNMQDASLAQQQASQTAISNGDIALGKSNAAITKSLADDTTAMNKRLQDASILRGYRAAQLNAPIGVTSPAMSPAAATRPQFLSVRVLTQSPAAIAAAGDNFLKFGYRLSGREWRITTLTPMSDFSYWTGDIVIASYSTNARTYDIIKSIFNAGVTVWKDPDKIGSTSIYDNRPEA